MNTTTKTDILIADRELLAQVLDPERFELHLHHDEPHPWLQVWDKREEASWTHYGDRLVKSLIRQLMENEREVGRTEGRCEVQGAIKRALAL